MIWNDHSRYEGQHALFAASRPSWLNYDEEHLFNYCDLVKAKERGTRLHKFAQDCIELGQGLPKKPATTLSLYVNDALHYEMKPEKVLFYSKYFFGTTDAIIFDGNLLRIHDLKTGGIPGKIEQLLIYDALFCLEYHIDPHDIEHRLRIYQFDDYTETIPEDDRIEAIMNQIVRFNELLLIREEENYE
jgi:hypothetical protein